jgi:hypothetical protein
MARQGISQQALADRLGWPQARVSRRIAVDGGKNPTIPFDVAELADVARALGVPVTRFLPAEVTA